jgi:hypothetical protein
MYFMGGNIFEEPWHLPHSPPNHISSFENVDQKVHDKKPEISLHEEK